VDDLYVIVTFRVDHVFDHDTCTHDLHIRSKIRFVRASGRQGDEDARDHENHEHALICLWPLILHNVGHLQSVHSLNHHDSLRTT
jgi:hypothetical protein